MEDDPYQKAAGQALKRYQPECWHQLGGSLDDARQEAMIGAWKAHERYDKDKSSLASWLYIGASSRLTNYYRKLRADQEKRSPARMVGTGLDDLAVEWRWPEENAESEQEVYGPDPAAKELHDKVRDMVFGAVFSTLTTRERWVLADEYEMEWNGVRPKLSKRERQEALDTALTKVRAEVRADEVEGL